MNLRGLHQIEGAGPAAPGQVRPHHSQARPHHNRPQLGQSRPQLDRAGRTNRCARTYHVPHLGSTAPTIPWTSLGWMKTLILCWFDQKAVVGSTSISMDPHLTVATAIKEWSWTSLNTVGASHGNWVGPVAPIGPAAPINLRVGRNRPKEPTYNRLRSNDHGRPSLCGGS
jgi:hypothetical protein